MRIKSLIDNKMAFFSSTDDTTLKERSKDMPHFLSVIVNNKLDCVAKITKVLNFNKADISYDKNIQGFEEEIARQNAFEEKRVAKPKKQSKSNFIEEVEE